VLVEPPDVVVVLELVFEVVVVVAPVVVVVTHDVGTHWLQKNGIGRKS